MRKYPLRRGFSAAVIAVVCVMLVTATAYAAWQFLQPADVAEQVGDNALVAAFNSDSAININQSVRSGDYIFTLLAVVNGQDISDMPHYSNGDLQNDRTYAVLAIENADGTAMSDAYYNDITFFASPLVKGLMPWLVNAATLHGSYSEKVTDGILYRLVQCDNVAVFADRGLYFAVNTGSFFNNEAFVYDETAGTVAVNPDFAGASAVFALPMEAGLADSAKAADMIKNLYPTESEAIPQNQGAEAPALGAPALLQQTGGD
ncbi:MAG: hypothetical protein LBS10_02375 [Gracilibacteraceae bacterium]|nr:hypothetical protein [Gracilibacteraceae bacterium]